MLTYISGSAQKKNRENFQLIKTENFKQEIKY